MIRLMGSSIEFGPSGVVQQPRPHFHYRLRPPEFARAAGVANNGLPCALAMGSKSDPDRQLNFTALTDR